MIPGDYVVVTSWIIHDYVRKKFTKYEYMARSSENNPSMWLYNV